VQQTFGIAVQTASILMRWA